MFLMTGRLLPGSGIVSMGGFLILTRRRMRRKGMRRMGQAAPMARISKLLGVNTHVQSIILRNKIRVLWQQKGLDGSDLVIWACPWLRICSGRDLMLLFI